ncbi:HAD family hydrolase [Mycolicibacterium houstonense]|uniref:HAD family hydrolase n=1 Tax=Mycolicibacterium houstonense TaxID=146021 RepID=UPI0008372DD3|nr:HAD family hydrolase [Mycolicibacterium houstonense]
MGGLQLPADVRALVFDVGETLVDESRTWSDQARQAGVTPFTLMGVIGALIERGEDHRAAWDMLGIRRPTTPPTITTADLYPDALACLRAARSAGLIVGVAGNQPAGAVEQLATLGFGADFVASSAEWNVSKPSAEFFTRLTRAAHLDACQIMYIGDRLDNDILPARSAGLRTALIRRGPWGHLHARYPEATLADLQLDSLARLTETLDPD